MLVTVVIFGLVNSAILMLTALGFSLTFGLSGVANFSYGGLYLLSGYVTWMFLNYFRWPLWLAVPLAILITGVLSALLYRIVLRPVRGLVLVEVIATFAIGVAILELFRWLGFVTYDFNLPVFVKGGVNIAGVVVDWQRLIILIVALTLAGSLWLFGRYTKIGLALRGMAQDEYTALAVGIESDWAATVSLGIGGAMVALAATVILPLGIISINTGYDVLLVALAVTVLGGLESTTGLIVSSLILGFATILTSTFVGPRWSEMIYLAAIVVALAIKPSGLFGQSKELEERV